MGIITPYFNFLFKEWLNFYCVFVLILLLPLLTNQTAHIQTPSERRSNWLASLLRTEPLSWADLLCSCLRDLLPAHERLGWGIPLWANHLWPQWQVTLFTKGWWLLAEKTTMDIGSEKAMNRASIQSSVPRTRSFPYFMLLPRMLDATSVKFFKLYSHPHLNYAS